MHSGTIFLRDTDDMKVLEGAVSAYASHFDASVDEILSGQFVKLFPLYLRPYGRLYAC